MPEYHHQQGPVYRVKSGRPPLGSREVLTRIRNFACPDDLWDEAREICADPVVARILSDKNEEEPANAADYIRAAILVMNLLCSQPHNRERILNLLLLPDYRMREVATQLTFKAAALPNPNPKRGIVNPDILLDDEPPGIVDPTEHANIYRQNEGLEPTPAGDDMTNPRPWQPEL